MRTTRPPVDPFGGLPTVVGHRGSGNGPDENTIPSFLRAVQDGATWIEFDVRLSADGDLMVHHDDRIDGTALRRLSTAALAARGIPTLPEVHAHLPLEIGFDVEVKIGLSDTPGDGLDVMIEAGSWAAGVARPTLLTSFCPSLFTLATDVPRGRVVGPTFDFPESIASAARAGVDVAVVHALDVLETADQPAVCAEVAEALATTGISVMAWGTLPEHVETLLAAGVRGLCVDDVPGTVAALAAAGRERP